MLTQLRLGGRHFSGRWGESWDEGWAERRYRSLFLAMDLTRDFYFSYTYDLSRTLQESAPPLPLRLLHTCLWACLSPENAHNAACAMPPCVPRRPC